LQNGEKLVWSGMPVNAWAHLRPTFGMFMFGLLAIHLTAMFVASFFGYIDAPIEGLSKDSSVLNLLVLLPFFIFGMSAMLSPLRALVKMKNTLYGISDQRVFIVSKFLRKRVQSWSFGSLNRLLCRDSRGNVGDVIFTHEWKSDGDGGEIIVEHGFLGIENARTVEAMIKEGINAARN
jgi:hypothetical protein